MSIKEINITAATEKLVNARELEKQILAREGIQVILLCPTKTKFKPYPWKYAALDKFSLARFRDERLVKHIGKGTEFIIVKSIEDVTNKGRWKLSNLRRASKEA